MRIYDERVAATEGPVADGVLSGSVLAINERRTIMGEVTGIGLSLDTGYYVQLDWDEVKQLVDWLARKKIEGWGDNPQVRVRGAP